MTGNEHTEGEHSRAEPEASRTTAQIASTSTPAPNGPSQEQELDLTKVEPDASANVPEGPQLRDVPITFERSQEQEREGTRSDLARGLLWLLAFAVGGVLAFIGIGRMEADVLAQSIFPSLIALAGTALGFYFGSQAGRDEASAQSSTRNPPRRPDQNL